VPRGFVRNNDNGDDVARAGVQDEAFVGESYQISERRTFPAITEAGSGVLWRDRR